MRKALLAAVALVPLALAPAPASAGGNSTYMSHCAYDGVLLYSTVVVYQPANPANVIGADVYCTLYFGDEEVAWDGFTGQGIVLGARTAPVNISGVDARVCTEIFYWTGDPSDRFCLGGGFLDSVVQDAVQATAIPDPVLCPVLSGLAPGVPGAVDITPAGDVGVAGGPVWDCPPYET